MPINQLLMACGHRPFEARQWQEAPECWRHFSVSGWPQVCRAHTTACKQVWAKNYSRTKQLYLVKIASWMIYNHINLSQKVPDKRKMIQKAQILTLKRNYNPRHSISVCSFTSSNLVSGAAVMAALQLFWIISVYLWYHVHFVIIIVEFLVTVLSITYLKNIFYGWTVPLSCFSPANSWILQIYVCRYPSYVFEWYRNCQINLFICWTIYLTIPCRWTTSSLTAYLSFIFLYRGFFL